MEFIKKYTYPILLTLILLVAVFLRFYNTPARYGLDPDATRDALISSYGASHLLFPATGPSSTLGDFRFGPWYYFKLISASMVLPTPYAPWIYMGVMSTIAVLVMYLLGRELEDKTFGLILAGLAAVSPALIAPATGLSNPNNVILHGALVSFLFVYIIRKSPAWWWGIFLGIELGFGINAHYQFIFYLVLPLFLLFAVKKNRIIYFASIAFGFVLTCIPLFIFDITHSLKITNGFIDAVEHSRINRVPNSWTIYLRDFWPTFFSYLLGVGKNIGMAIGVFTVFANMYLLIKKKLSKPYVLLMIMFLIMFVGLRFYPGERAVYYLYFLEPLIIVFVGMLFYLPFKLNLKGFKYIAAAAYLVLLSYVCITTVPNFHTYDTRIDAFRKANKIITKFPNDKFVVYSCRNIEDYKTQGVVFALGTMGKLDTRGKAVGIINDCGFEKNNNSPLFDKEITYLSGKSLQEIKKDGWVLISAKTVYNYYARWYNKSR